MYYSERLGRHLRSGKAFRNYCRKALLWTLFGDSTPMPQVSTRTGRKDQVTLHYRRHVRVPSCCLAPIPTCVNHQFLTRGAARDAFLQKFIESCVVITPVLGNRQWNRGLRLDYFLAHESLIPSARSATVTKVESGNHSKELFPPLVVVDSFILDESVIGASDHAPVGVVLQRRSSS
jgi:hypothetical protein